MKESLGSRVKKLRKDRKLTQKELAINIKVSDSTISKIESGFKENADKNILITLANFFDVSIDYLLGKSENPDIHDADVEFATRFKLDLKDDDLLKMFDVSFGDRELNQEEIKTALAVLRAFFDSKNS